ncbi:MAG: cytochrome C oxidase subunit IV family protein [Thiohalorhabdus sp.]|uniref:cytochrome C oxidase subunit IV family protein n=1 Tax=Thiohalorhabdus sp. TaxID=3094134 RepID=UPI00398183C3
MKRFARSTVPEPAPTATWLLLLALTGVTYAIGELHVEGPVLIFGALGVALLKGRLIAWRYMELARVQPLWRLVVGAWLAAVGGLIATAFLLAGS